MSRVSVLLTHAVEMKASCRAYTDNIKNVSFVEDNQFTCVKAYIKVAISISSREKSNQPDLVIRDLLFHKAWDAGSSNCSIGVGIPEELLACCSLGLSILLALCQSSLVLGSVLELPQARAHPRSRVQVCLEMSMQKLHLPGQAESPPHILNILLLLSN